MGRHTSVLLKSLFAARAPGRPAFYSHFYFCAALILPSSFPGLFPRDRAAWGMNAVTVDRDPLPNPFDVDCSTEFGVKGNIRSRELLWPADGLLASSSRLCYFAPGVQGQPSSSCLARREAAQFQPRSQVSTVDAFTVDSGKMNAEIIVKFARYVDLSTVALSFR